MSQWCLREDTLKAANAILERFLNHCKA
jgi:hypothetical protein